MTLAAVATGVLGAAREALRLTLQVSPCFFIGATAGAAVQAFLSQRWSERLFAGRGLRPLVAAIDP